MLVFLFVLLIILSSIILLLALTSIQIQINNLIIKNNKKEDGEVKIVLKLLKIIPYFEIDVLNSKFIKKEITLKKHPRLKNKISLKKLIEIADLEELYVKLNLQSENLIFLTFATVLVSTILSIMIHSSRMRGSPFLRSMFISASLNGPLVSYTYISGFGVAIFSSPSKLTLGTCSTFRMATRIFG